MLAPEVSRAIVDAGTGKVSIAIPTGVEDVSEPSNRAREPPVPTEPAVMSRPESLRAAAVAFVDRWQSAQLGFAAAGIAYYGLVSLLPTLVLLILGLTTIQGDAVAERVLTEVGEVLTRTGERLVRDAVASGTGRRETTVLGFLVLLWGVSRLFRGLERGFERASHSRLPQSTRARVRAAILALASVALAVLVLLTATTLLARVGVGQVGGRVGQFLALVLVLFPVFYVLSDRSIGPRDAIPGAVVTAGGWSVLGSVFNVYLEFVGGGLLSSVLGGLVLLVTWLYLASLLLLAGAVVNSVLTSDDPGRT